MSPNNDLKSRLRETQAWLENEREVNHHHHTQALATLQFALVDVKNKLKESEKLLGEKERENEELWKKIIKLEKVGKKCKVVRSFKQEAASDSANVPQDAQWIPGYVPEKSKPADQCKDDTKVKDSNEVYTDGDDTDEDEKYNEDKMQEAPYEKSKSVQYKDDTDKLEDEMQEARKVLINGWDSASCAFIGVKTLGELDMETFQAACKRKYPKKEADDHAAALLSLWENYLGDSNWQPFRTIRTLPGVRQVIIDEEDDKLRRLKQEFGGEVFVSVSAALLELIKYNPSSRDTRKELWNFEEGRKASLKEGILSILNQLKCKKRKTTS